MIQNQYNKKLNKDTINEIHQQKQPNFNINIPTAYTMTRNLGKELVNNQISKISVLLSAKNEPTKFNSTGQYNINYMPNSPISQTISKPDIYKNEQNLAPLMASFMKSMNLDSTSPKNMETTALPKISAVNQNQGTVFSNTLYHPPFPVPTQNQTQTQTQTLKPFFNTTSSNLNATQNQSNRIFTHLNNQNMNGDR